MKPRETFLMCWYQRSFGIVGGSFLKQHHNYVRSFCWITPWAAAPVGSFISLSGHILKPGCGILLVFVGGLETLSELLLCCSFSFLIHLTHSQDWLFSFLFFPLLFVSLPVFIKLVKSLLQLRQPCIMLCCSHHHALQLPGNWAWQRHLKRQRTPSDGK